MKISLNRRCFLAAAGGITAGLALTPLASRADARKPMKDVIVLLPGIGGSVLRKADRDVWALSEPWDIALKRSS
ncbi:MAG: hypothetical protein EXS36_00735 [Pedosphaera sp.]|nr:hypothetical protein [Pedosphaera sp.]